jgi:hypothetical protein
LITKNGQPISGQDINTGKPLRFSFLMGKYAWCKEGAGFALGNAALIIPTIL